MPAGTGVEAMLRSQLSQRLMLLLAASASLLAPLLGVQLAVGARNADACSCVPRPEMPVAIREASGIFSARVVSISEPFEDLYGDLAWSVELHVETVWKGDATTTTFVYVRTEYACGYGGFAEGQKYLVYTMTLGEETHVSYCSRTQPLALAAEDLLMLGEGRPPLPGSTGATPAPEAADQEALDPATATAEQIAAPSPAIETPGDASVPAEHAIPVWLVLLSGVAAILVGLMAWRRRTRPTE